MKKAEFMKVLPGKIKKPVEQIDDNGQIVATHGSVKEAASSVKRSSVAICVAISQGYQSAGFWWKHKKSNFNHVKQFYCK